jgi:hypothetical protein
MQGNLALCAGQIPSKNQNSLEYERGTLIDNTIACPYHGKREMFQKGNLVYSYFFAPNDSLSPVPDP